MLQVHLFHDQLHSHLSKLRAPRGSDDQGWRAQALPMFDQFRFVPSFFKVCQPRSKKLKNGQTKKNATNLGLRIFLVYIGKTFQRCVAFFFVGFDLFDIFLRVVRACRCKLTRRVQVMSALSEREIQIWTRRGTRSAVPGLSGSCSWSEARNTLEWVY